MSFRVLLRCAAAVLLPALLLAAGTDPPGMQDDAYHFPQFQDGKYDFSYAEWWYFNLVDPEQDLHLVVAYSIFSPASAFGRAAVTAVAYTADGTVTVTESFPTSAFSASTVLPDVNVGGVNSIQVVDLDTYQVAGALEGDHAISWFLGYVPQAAPWLGSAGEQVGWLPWERMSWLNFMPGAEVTGWVTIDGHTYLLAGASGYHDHNWGEWIPTEVVWNWAQYHEPGFSLGLGDFRNWPAGVVGVDLDGERIVFEKGQYLLVHTKWELSPQTGLPVPTRSWLYACNGKVKLTVDMDVERTEALLPPPELPFAILKPVIYEQTASFDGQLWVKTGGGAWTLARPFEGQGFKEFTGRVPAN
jgi:hypothetical protein